MLCGRFGTIELLLIITGLILVVLLLALFFSLMFVVTGVVMIFSLSAVAISFAYYNITDGSLVMLLWVVPILLFLIVAILIILGWLSVIPPKFNRKEKTSFKIRIFNIIILILTMSLITAAFIVENISILSSEIPSLAI